MKTPTRSLDEIRQAAIELLCRELGPVNTIRFLNQYSTGHGNYTEERDAILGDWTIDEILTEIKKKAREREKT